MLDLARLLEEAGCEDVAWHIHTGNMFLTAAAEREKVADAIADRLHAHGMRNAWAMVWSPDELRTLVASQPFAGFDPSEYVLEASFFDAPPQWPDTQFLTDLGAIVVRWHAVEAVARRRRERAGDRRGTTAQQVNV